jgi:hypothetical protein
MKFKANVSNKIYWGLGIVFLGIYFLVICLNTYNIPRWDDFSIFLQFLCDYVESSSFTEKFGLVFEQHNEHRIAVARIAGFLYYRLTGEINFVALIIIGNLFLLGIGIIFLKSLKQKENAGIFALMTVLLLFNGQNFETGTWAIALFANVGTLFLLMLSIYFVLQPGKPYFITGLILSVISIYSNGHGICLLPAVLLSFFLQRKTKNLMWFAIVTGIAVICYFFNWEFHNVENASASRYIPDIITSFFCFLGGSLWLPSAKFIAFFCGLFIFGTYVLALAGKFYKKNIVWFTFFTAMIIAAAMVSLSRNPNAIAPLRYRIFCCIVAILTVMFYFENREIRHIRTLRWIRLAMPFVMMFSIFSSLLYLDRKQKDSEFLKVSTYNWQHSKSGLHYASSHAPVATLQRAEDLHIYTMPKLPLKDLASTVETTGNKWQNHSSRIFHSIDYIDETDEYVLIKGWAYTDGTGMDFTDISLWLFNENQNIKIHPYAERRYELPFSLTVNENCGFFAVIPKAALPQGSYNLGIEIQKKYIVPIKKSVKSIDTDIQVQI